MQIDPAALAIKSLAFSAQGNAKEAQAALDAARATLKGQIEYYEDGSVVGKSVLLDHDELIADLLIQEAATALPEAE